MVGFFNISHPFSSQSILVWVQVPIEPLIYFLFQLKWRNTVFLVIISVIYSWLPFPCHECPSCDSFHSQHFILLVAQWYFDSVLEIHVSVQDSFMLVKFVVGSGLIHMKSIQTQHTNHIHWMISLGNECLTCTKLNQRWVGWWSQVFCCLTDWRVHSLFAVMCWDLPPHLYWLLHITFMCVGCGKSIVHVYIL